MKWDDDLIAAYADGELHILVQYLFEESLEQDEALRERVERQKALRSRLGAHFGAVMDEPVPERLRAMLGRPQDEKVVAIETARRRRLPPRAWIPAAMAASLVAGLFGGQVLRDNPGLSSATVAHGDLAEVLDTQLASAPTTNAATQVGTTFRDRQGRVCRTFDGAEVAGFACREQGDWRIQMLAPGSGRQDGGYRQASSGAMLVLQAAQERMAGEPLGAEEERRLRDSGWR
jgi:hypothetical protein